MERLQTDVIPFGKYKGQPLATLQADAAYCEWLLAQAWFVQRYPSIHTVVINHFGEPSETPEHNRLQLRFLDPVFRARATQYVLASQDMLTPPEEPSGWSPTLVRFEVEGQDVSWSLAYWHWTVECDFDASEHYNALARLYQDDLYVLRSQTRYSTIFNEKRAFIDRYWPPYRACLDAKSVVETGQYVVREWGAIGVECKPSLGDDYPAVLRFLLNLPARKHEVYQLLLIGAYEGRGGSFEEVRTFFRLSNILLATVDDIEATPPLLLASRPPLMPPDPAWLGGRERVASGGVLM